MLMKTYTFFKSKHDAFFVSFSSRVWFCYKMFWYWWEMEAHGYQRGKKKTVPQRIHFQFLAVELCGLAVHPVDNSCRWERWHRIMSKLLHLWLHLVGWCTCAEKVRIWGEHAVWTSTFVMPSWYGWQMWQNISLQAWGWITIKLLFFFSFSFFSCKM